MVGQVQEQVQAHFALAEMRGHCNETEVEAMYVVEMTLLIV